MLSVAIKLGIIAVVALTLGFGIGSQAFPRTIVDTTISTVSTTLIQTSTSLVTISERVTDTFPTATKVTSFVTKTESVTSSFTVRLTETTSVTYGSTTTITHNSTSTVKIGPETIAVCFSRTDFCRDDIVTIIENARTSVYVMAFSFTADEIADALIKAKNRGLDVKVVIDNMQATVMGSEFQRLQAAGVEVRTDRRTALMHHKVVIVDGEIVITGSYNLSDAAEDDNDENLIILKDRDLAAKYRQEFNRVWAVAETATTTTTQTTTSAATPKIWVNEVEPNPAGNDAGNEWVELYNPNDFQVDIGGWTVSTTAGVTVTIMIPSGAKISAKGYYVVGYSQQWIDNTGESIVLKDSSGNVVDSTPSLNDDSNDSRSWQRIPDGGSSWQFRASTRGFSDNGSI